MKIQLQVAMFLRYFLLLPEKQNLNLFGKELNILCKRTIITDCGAKLLLLFATNTYFSLNFYFFHLYSFLVKNPAMNESIHTV